MRFSICIPTYNRAYIIRKPLESLVKQSFKDFEVLVIDDGSTDNTESVVDIYKTKLQLTYIKKENGGKHTALNAALDIAKGELFMILDSDDELLPDALDSMNELWNQYKNNSFICGVMGRCTSNDQIIGRQFPQSPGFMSYVAFHNGKGGGRYGDCCECVRTDIINKYRWPEYIDTHFVPESYVYDMIGLEYQTVTVNDVFEIKEYQNNGITLNYREYIRNNINGFLFASVSKIEHIFKNAKAGDITLISKIKVWARYWDYVRFDTGKNGSRVEKMTFIGIAGYLYWQLKRLLLFLRR